MDAVVFNFNPPKDIEEELSFVIDIVLTDNHMRAPLSSVTSFKVVVRPRDEVVDFDINKLRDKQQGLDLDLPPPKMVYEANKNLNTLLIRFDQIVLLPSDIRNYTS